MFTCSVLSGLGYSPYDSYDDSYDCGLQQGLSVLQVVSRPSTSEVCSAFRLATCRLDVFLG